MRGAERVARSKSYFWRLANSFLIILFCLACLIPMLHIIAVSLNDSMDGIRGGIGIWPRILSLENFKKVFGDDRVGSAFAVTVFRTLIGTVLMVIFNGMYAYALSKRRLAGRRFFAWWAILPMYFGPTLIPLYLIYRGLGLTDSIWIYVLPYIFAPFYIIVYRTFFVGIPEALEESAHLDGASDLVIFFKIYMPLSMPVVATIALFGGVYHWNDWLVSEAFVFNEDLWTLQKLLLFILKSTDTSDLQNQLMQMMRSHLGGDTVTTEALRMAMIVICSMPIIIIYPFLQKYFVKGLTIGSVK
jgi:putative aldouronate transport system permease protein